MHEQGLSPELTARLEAGDEHAFAELFAHYRDRLKVMLEFRLDRRLRGRVDPSDVVQDVYLDACQRMRHYLKRPELSFYVWLRQLTNQRLVDLYRFHFKAEMRSVLHEVAIDGSHLSASSASMAIRLVAHQASPSQLVMQAELLTQVEDALNNMSPLDREVLALRHFEELTNQEVAEVLGIKVAAASNRYVRALSRLRAVLERLPGFLDNS